MFGAIALLPNNKQNHFHRWIDRKNSDNNSYFMNFNQTDFEVRCEWGKQGVLQLDSVSDVIVIVDVLSFSTCVDIANSQGAIVYPYQWKDESASSYIG
jgi:hypothetical protein